MVKNIVSVNLDEEDLAFLEEVSLDTGLSVSATIRYAVKDWIHRRKLEAEKDEKKVSGRG